ncbi:hypothetical protein G6F60_007937 [Rhizopus arrhizus]|nr:hypothetical protein G6F60_007937 [Rhizopus arrhizus]
MPNENSTPTLTSFQLDSGGPLLPEEFSLRRCFLRIEEEPNDAVENLYGPFSVPYNHIHRPPTNNKQLSALEKRQLEIMQLKKDIEERERLQSNLIRLKKDQERPSSAPPIPTSTLSKTSTPSQTIQQATIVQKSSLAVVNQDKMATDVFISISDQEMDDTSEEEDDIEDKTEEIEQPSIQQQPTIDPKIVSDLQKAWDRIEMEIKEGEKLLEKNKSVTKDIRVKLLALQVKMSIERNRKRPRKSNNADNQNSKRDHTQPPQQQQQQQQKRRVKRRTNPIGYPYMIPHFHQQIPFMHQPMPLPLVLPPTCPPPLYYRPNNRMPGSPPPPPPASPPPPAPPPPPPPSSVKNNPFLTDRQLVPREEEPSVKMQDGTAVSAVLQEIQQLVSLRVSNVEDKYEKVNDRILPRTPILTTIDGYTMTKDMVLSNQQDNGFADDFINIPTNNESPFFAMLSRKATGQIFDEAMDLFVTRVLSCIPSDANINIFQQDSHGLFPRKLMEALDFVRKESQQDPRNEFKATLKVELSLFVHGRSEQLKRDYEESIRELPQCVDVHWQHIRSENNSETQMKLIVDLLSRIAQARTSVNTEQSNKISGMTLEILIRFLRMPNGMSKVLKILTNNDDDDIIETKSVQLFSMEETTGIYLTEQDKYLIWMVILYYYVTKTIPDNICQNWMDKLVKTGKASTEKPMFMIDWTPTLENKPLDRQSQIGCVNILLSMLRHFGNKACNDISRRPLLIGVLRTLLNLLPFSPSYKLAGTLILTRKALQLKSLQPEMQEIVIELELKAKNNIVFSDIK